MRIVLRVLVVVLVAKSIATTLHAAPIELPVEIVGPDGYLDSRQFALKEDNIREDISLALVVNNLSYETKGAVQLNEFPFIPLDNHHCAIHGIGETYGGIGGPTRTRGVVPTIQLTVKIPPGQLKAGVNSITFRFNATDGVSSGYRVVSFNFRNARQRDLLLSSSFRLQSPKVLAIPVDMSPVDIDAGRRLWQSAILQDSPRNPGKLRAHCVDCHAIDGRYLQYFGFSNHSIIVRSQFHGLTELQGKQIAAYVRSHPIQPQALPYAPVYQPGPGTSGRPIEARAAGAGLESIADDPKTVLAQLVKTQSPAGVFDSIALLRVVALPIHAATSRLELVAAASPSQGRLSRGTCPGESRQERVVPPAFRLVFAAFIASL